MWARMRENPTATATAVSVLSLLTGAGSCFLIVSKRLEAKYEEISSEEIAAAREYYKKLYKAEEYSSPEAMAESLGITTPTETSSDSDEAKSSLALLREYQGRIPEAEVETEPQEKEVVVEQTINIFANAERQDPSIWAEDQASGRPHIISTDEYMHGDTDYSQTTLVWFQGDGVLVDADEKPIPDAEVDAIVGEDNMLRFGHGSGDPNIVYIRNDRREAEYEVVLDKKSYSADVLGLQHSDDPRRRKNRKFRVTDE
jgi:hypothetical protein